MIFYVDPMSYNNLEIYDNQLLNNIKGLTVIFFGNIRMKNKPVNSKLIYKYSNKKHIMKFFSYFNSQLKLYLNILKYRPALIHFQWLKVPYIDYLLIKLISELGIKVIFTAHNKLPHNTKMKYKKIYSKIYKKLDIIIVHAEKTKEELIEIFMIDEKKIKVIPHGILEITKEKISDIDILKKLNMNKVKISFLGNISKYKGFDYVVNAWNTFETPIKNIQLIIAGQGDFSQNNKFLNRENILIDNRFLNEKEFYTYLKYSDIVLLPYREISQSGVLLSALAEKKIVIVTDKGGLGEPYKLFDLGWLIKGEDVSKELFDILSEIEINPNIINSKKKSIEAWEKIQEYYSWEKIGEETKRNYIKEINNIF